MSSTPCATSGRREPSELERAFYGESVEVHAPSSPAEIREILRFAEAHGRPVVPAGLGAHAGIADPPPEEAIVLSSCALGEILTYEPEDFTVTAQAGVPLGRLREVLRRRGQEIPIDLPTRACGTLGGLVARAPAGPRLSSCGPLANSILGLAGMRSSGRPFRAGGRVVKNVAGYEIAKFLAGSLGAAALLLHVSLRLRPLPARRIVCWGGFAEEEEAWALAHALRASGLEPAVLVVLAGSAPAAAGRRGLPCPRGEAVVGWAFEGESSTVAWQEEQVEKLPALRRAERGPVLEGPEGERAIGFLASFAEPCGGAPPDLGITRLSLLSSDLPAVVTLARTALEEKEGVRAGFLADVCAGLLTIRWQAPPERVAEPAALAASLGRERLGGARLLYLPPHVRGEFHHHLTPERNRTLRARVLHAFDPSGLFGRARANPPSPDGREAW